MRFDWLKRNKSDYERGLDQTQLAQSGFWKYARYIGVGIGIFAVFIVIVLGLGMSGWMTRDDWLTVLFGGSGLIVVGLVGSVIYRSFVFAKTPVYHIEFGFEPNIRVSEDLAIDKQNTKTLETELKNHEEYFERLRQYFQGNVDKDGKAVSEKERLKIEELMRNKDSKWKMTYFSHPDQLLKGWDKQTSSVHIFGAFILFHPLPVNEQFIHTQGQDNWDKTKTVMMNHPQEERLNVKPFIWVPDPFADNLIPMCVLKHSTLDYKPDPFDEGQIEETIKLFQAMASFQAFQHGQINGLKKENMDKDEALKGEQKTKEEYLKLIDKGMSNRFAFIKRGMELPKTGWLRVNLGKTLLIVGIIIAASVLIYAIMNGWITFFGSQQTSNETTTGILYFLKRLIR